MLRANPRSCGKTRTHSANQTMLSQSVCQELTHSLTHSLTQSWTQPCVGQVPFGTNQKILNSKVIVRYISIKHSSTPYIPYTVFSMLTQEFCYGAQLIVLTLRLRYTLIIYLLWQQVIQSLYTHHTLKTFVQTGIQIACETVCFLFVSQALFRLQANLFCF